MAVFSGATLDDSTEMPEGWEHIVASKPGDEKEGYPMAKKRKVRTIFRDAGTGRFVSREYARRHPKTTVGETVPVPRTRKKK